MGDETLICARCTQPRGDHTSTPPHPLPELEPPLAGVTCEGYLASIPCLNEADTGAPGTSDKELHDEEDPHGRAETSCPAYQGDTRGSFGGGGASGGW